MIEEEVIASIDASIEEEYHKDDDLLAYLDADEEESSEEETDDLQDYSLKEYETFSGDLESESANVLWRFLLARGLGQWVMTAILIMEWFRLYLAIPIIETANWILDRKPEKLLSSQWLNARGGALSSSTNSDDEDAAEQQQKKKTE